MLRIYCSPCDTVLFSLYIQEHEEEGEKKSNYYRMAVNILYTKELIAKLKLHCKCRYLNGTIAWMRVKFMLFTSKVTCRISVNL